MKKIALILLVSLAFVQIASAQKPKKEFVPVEERANKQTEHIQSVTNCSPEQANQIKLISAAKFSKIDAVRAKYKGQKENVEARKAEIKTIRKEFRDELKKVLTPEQLKKLHEFHKAQKQSKANPPSGEENDNDDYKE